MHSLKTDSIAKESKLNDFRDPRPPPPTMLHKTKQTCAHLIFACTPSFFANS